MNKKIKQITKSSIKIGDVLKILKTIPDNSVDLTITSPPYNKRNRTRGWLVKGQKYSNFDDHLPEEQYQEWQIEVINEIFRVTKPGGSMFYNHKLRWEDGSLIHPLTWLAKSFWDIKQEIVWDRAIAANMRGWRYWQVDERIYWLHKAENGNLIGEELASKHAKFSSIWRIKPEPRTKLHPAPFPIELPARIILSILNSKKGVVMDPFSGSGTTLSAAKILGHKYIGIEKSRRYANNSIKRLKKLNKDKLKVDLEKGKHVIDETFKERKKRGNTKWPFGPKINLVKSKTINKKKKITK